MIATLEPRSPLDLWRQRLGGRCRRTQPRPLAAMGYLLGGRATDGLIEVEKLTIVLVYDEQIRPGHCALRLAGYSGKRVPWGVRFGGPGQCMFFKDLALQPVAGGSGLSPRRGRHGHSVSRSWPWNANWTAISIGNGTFANMPACQSCGPASDQRTLPTSPATGRN